MNNVKNNIKGKFTTTPNELINDDSIDPIARFLFVYMASKPNDWKFYQKELMKALNVKDPRTFRKYVDELIDTGWVERERLRQDGARFDSYEYVLHPEPVCKKCTVEKMHPAKNAPLTNTNPKQIKTETKTHTHKEKTPESESEVKTAIAMLPLNGDTIESRMMIWDIVEPYLKTPAFKSQWKFMGGGAVPADDVLKEWVCRADFFHVKEFRLNKASGWIKNYQPKTTTNGHSTRKPGSQTQAGSIAQYVQF